MYNIDERRSKQASKLRHPCASFVTGGLKNGPRFFLFLWNKGGGGTYNRIAAIGDFRYVVTIFVT